MKYKWRGILATEGVPTGDGRMIEKGALRWEDLPNQLSWAPEDGMAHQGGFVVGRIDMMERRGDDIYAEGEFVDTDDDDRVLSLVRLIAGDFMDGVSLDLSDITAELRVAKELFEDEWVPLDEREEDEDGRIVLFEINPDDEIMVFTDALSRGATMVSKPAFANAYIEVLGEDGEPLEPDSELAEATADDLKLVADATGGFSLIAGAVAEDTTYKRSLFERPDDLEEGQNVTVTKDGRVFGYIAQWGTCHVGFEGVCVEPPRGSDYSSFHQSTITTNAGPLRVGKLTVGGGHAKPGLAARPAVEHYDNVGSCAAWGRVGEDDHGIWFAGVLDEDIDEVSLRRFRRSPVSGDWRNIAGRLELIAVCSVNDPGFPVRPQVAASAANEQTCLIASSSTLEFEAESAPAPIDPAALAREIAREMRAQERDEALAAEAAEIEAEMLGYEDELLRTSVDA